MWPGKEKLRVMPIVSFGGAEWTMMSPLEIESTGGGKSLLF